MLPKKSLWGFLSLLLILSTGCRGEEVLGQDELSWVWLAASLLLFGLGGGALVYLRRSQQIESWDLGSSPTEPDARGIVKMLLTTWVVLSIAFVILNLRLEIDPGQAFKNIALWIGGSTVGGLLGLYIGLNSAEPRLRSTKKES